MSQVKVSAKRHLAKTISYRIISTLVGFLIMWRLTGKIEIGAAFGVIELLYKPIQYYIHERVWYRWISYGLIKSNPVRKYKIKTTRDGNKVPSPSVSKPRITPNVPPEDREQLNEGVDRPTLPQIKRLTYTKKSDN